MHRLANRRLRGCAVRAQLSREPPPRRELEVDMGQAYNQVRQNPIALKVRQNPIRSP